MSLNISFHFKIEVHHTIYFKLQKYTRVMLIYNGGINNGSNISCLTKFKFIQMATLFYELEVAKELVTAAV